MKLRSEVDRAFAALIEASAELLAQGRARTPFSVLRPQPKRIGLDFDRVRSTPEMEHPLTPEQKEGYSALYRELNRFEPRALLFTSPEPGQGVSFTAHNLARMWSSQQGRKVLLLELYNGGSGLSYELPEGAPAAQRPQELEDYIFRCPDNGLYLFSGHATQSGGMEGETWQRLQASFDLIVADCSPFWHNALAAKLAAKTDGVIFICSRPPAKPVVDRLERDLDAAGARFIGVIMNAVDTVRPAARKEA